MRRSGPRAVGVALVLWLGPTWAVAGVRPSYGGELRVALPLLPHTTDPALATSPSELLVARALHATPLVLGADGQLAPGLLAEVPTSSDGRTWRLVVRQGLRFSDGSPLGAADLAASLTRLVRPATGSPHAWLALPILGAEAVAEGRATAISGLQVASAHELLVTLAFPLPSFPSALAALPAAVVSTSGAGAGPFRPSGQPHRYLASDQAWRGRPFVDAISFQVLDPRSVARALEEGRIDLAFRPEAGPAGLPLPLLAVTAAVVNGPRLAGAAAAVRRALQGLDRTELVHRFVRGTAEPLTSLLPPALLPSGERPPAPEPAATGGGAGVSILIPGWLADPRAVAERLQVKLFDAGLRATLEPADPTRHAARLAARDWDVALVTVPLQTTARALAAAQVAQATGGLRAARQAAQVLAEVGDDAAVGAVEAVRAELDLVPLYVAAWRAFAAPALQGLVVAPDGGFDPGDLWLWRTGSPP